MEGLGLGFEFAKGVVVAAVPDAAAHRLRAAGAEADLLLARGEGGAGAREVGSCGFLRGRGKRGNDLADSVLRGFFLDFEDVGDRVLELRRGWAVLRRYRQRLQPRQYFLRSRHSRDSGELTSSFTHCSVLFPDSTNLLSSDSPFLGIFSFPFRKWLFGWWFWYEWVFEVFNLLLVSPVSVF